MKEMEESCGMSRSFDIKRMVYGGFEVLLKAEARSLPRLPDVPAIKDDQTLFPCM